MSTNSHGRRNKNIISNPIVTSWVIPLFLSKFIVTGVAIQPLLVPFDNLSTQVGGKDIQFNTLVLLLEQFSSQMGEISHVPSQPGYQMSNRVHFVSASSVIACQLRHHSSF